MAEVIALLDKPSPESMGAVPIVLRDTEDFLFVSGLANSAVRSITDPELEELVNSRQAVRVNSTSSINTSASSNLMAMWIGKDFAVKASRLGVRVPPLPSEELIETAGGRASIGNPNEVHARLIAWLEKAFRHAVTTSSAPIAKLMAQVMPDHELTQAALWYSVSDQEKPQELSWFVRLSRDAGRSCSLRKLQRHFERLCQHPPWASIKLVLLVSGRAGSRHGDVAKKLKRRIGERAPNSSMVSFGKFLRKRWKELHGSRPTKPDLQRLGQDHVRAGPYFFARQVLMQKSSQPEILIVDGVRHRVIKEAIEFMIESPIVPLAVEPSEVLVVRQLAKQVGITQVDRVREHETEQEVQNLIAEAKQRIQYSEPDDVGREVDRTSKWAITELSMAS